MKGVQFYEEFVDTRKTVSKGTVIAIAPSTIHLSNHQVVYDAIDAVLDQANSPVCGTSASQTYLAALCKRISEKRAREIHPQLFKRLDD